MSEIFEKQKLTFNDSSVACEVIHFNGGIRVGAVENPEYCIRTMISFTRVIDPPDHEIGDDVPSGAKETDGIALSFAHPSSVQVVIDALEIVKADMNKYIEKNGLPNQPHNSKEQW